ncbi:MAG TPA: S-adenosylmethionine:tRNA ribosyltransferase-isomerase [Chitinophagaceae bacterium]|nr:S-adenosylmethionine:tRNA ribosyltransferase-isomerase [Chitinophagaceae bacterium]
MPGHLIHPKYLSIEDYNYVLPDEKIASYPLEKRDESKLLIFHNNEISENRYKNISEYLPEKSLLVFNDTKVIKARILFQKLSGGVIEIFCLEPYEDVKDYAVIFQKKKKIKWKCMIGGASKWKEKFLVKTVVIDGEEIQLKASVVEKLKDAYVVELAWSPGQHPFAEIMESAGDTPLPPYIKRKAEEADTGRYQTIYSKYEGSVAAPTAGLHFTPHIFYSLKEKNINTAFTTLHVGAGTFRPVKSATMEDHEMHAEWMEVSTDFVELLLKHLKNEIICVGTTSVRTIESLFWMGVKSILYPDQPMEELAIKQWEVYGEDMLKVDCSPEKALTSLLKFLQNKKIKKLLTQTQIIIAPGYQFKLTKALITNFHQPKSTLLLLVAAMAGKDWRKIYEYALENEFRFLSYGDGCVIFNS